MLSYFVGYYYVVNVLHYPDLEHPSLIKNILFWHKTHYSGIEHPIQA